MKLKTEDLERYVENPKKFQEALKTLKDLKIESENPMFNLGADEQRGRIKQQSIKWIKKDIRDAKYLFKKDIIERWIKRLNITEGDLK